MKSKVFKLAHQIKGLFNSFSSALKASWRIVKMSMGITVDIEFAKDGGEIREARVIAIGSLSTVEKGFVRFLENVGEKTQWRSFRIERLLF